ncbi:MAG: type 1 glutamine amidotransferase [Rhodopseudomonas palustris]|uniref:Type 1 glutamine amidotransferase n=1 Tax=Rhodopseudomonas palustris TaxID=1076 RepID=A0A933W503_RHOPL|nr:type 1 glutamine amidotransferase [Rhodopseudomonas palustris]
MVRLLVAEGNSNEDRRQIVAAAGRSMADAYADTLRLIDPALSIDTFSPADESDGLPAPLGSYDGVVITGSSLHVYRLAPAVTRQIEFLREVYALGVPVFGSCWGLQLGVAAAGGRVVANPRGREVPFATGITLTEAGQTHPMHRSRPASYDALAIHADIVAELPPGAMVTAFNGMAAVQAAEFRVGRSRFFGVQYHPEFELPYMAAILRRNAPSLIAERSVRSEAELMALIDQMESHGPDPAPTSADARPAISDDIRDRKTRLTEIINWIGSIG